MGKSTINGHLETAWKYFFRAAVALTLIISAGWLGEPFQGLVVSRQLPLSCLETSGWWYTYPSEKYESQLG